MMTCLQTLSLLSDYADQSLSDRLKEAVEAHLQECSACNSEWNSVKRLVSMLGERPRPDPGEPYWQELDKLILARTSETVRPAADAINDAAFSGHGSRRRSLLRSLVSAAASICILVSALLVGTSQEYRQVKVLNSESPMLLSSSLTDSAGAQLRWRVVDQERVILARSLSCIGTPGLLGRFTGVPDLVASR
ncbi:MAG: zf-HC2 domain-containing protein [Candidatus Zixiibacteriota bacterium]|nr:MAG: zf-HC2 domain-containing protein [candidate division Zixibacteria bacterium]